MLLAHLLEHNGVVDDPGHAYDLIQLAKGKGDAMNTPNDVTVLVLERSKGLLERYSSDLSPTELLHRATEKGNCTAWLIGHLTLADRRPCWL